MQSLLHARGCTLGSIDGNTEGDAAKSVYRASLVQFSHSHQDLFLKVAARQQIESISQKISLSLTESQKNGEKVTSVSLSRRNGEI